MSCIAAASLNYNDRLFLQKSFHFPLRNPAKKNIRQKDPFKLRPAISPNDSHTQLSMERVMQTFHFRTLRVRPVANGD